MDAAQAIADLTEISPQLRSVAVLAPDGAVVGSNVGAGEAERLADASRRLLAAADEAHRTHGRGPVAQVEVALSGGSVFVVRDGERSIVATTSAEPTVGLVFYDLKTCLRSIEAPKPKPRRRAQKKQEDPGGDAAA